MSKRDEILAAAQALFAEYGYAGTTMRMIAERAGVAFGLVSHYFGNKEKLFLVAGHEMIDAMLLGIRRDTEAAQNGLQAVDIFVNSYLSYTLANRATFPTLIRCSPFSDDNPHLDRHKIGAKFEELIREIEMNLERDFTAPVPSITPLLPVQGDFVGSGGIPNLIQLWLQLMA